MKTYQIDIDDKLFPELKRMLNLLPPNGVRLYNQKGKEIPLDANDVVLTEELIKSINEGISELDKGEGIAREDVVNELQARYPNLKF